MFSLITDPVKGETKFRSVQGIVGQDAANVVADANGSIHPEDEDIMRRSIADSIQNLTQWNWIGRAITAEGKIKWLQGKSEPQETEDGQIRWSGRLMDITAEVTAQQAKAEAEKAKLEAEAANLVMAKLEAAAKAKMKAEADAKAKMQAEADAKAKAKEHTMGNVGVCKTSSVIDWDAALTTCCG